MKSALHSSNYAVPPDEGVPKKVRAGVYWLRMPLPFELSHINLWLLEGAHGWTIIDTGFNFGKTIEHWDTVFTGFFKDKPIEDIFITHFHPDHFGLAGDLARRTDVTLRMTEGEFAMVKSLMNAETLRKIYLPYYVEAGITGDLLEQMIEKRLFYKKIVSLPPEKIWPVKLDSKMYLGDREWEIIGGGGHTPEHACLYCRKDRIFIAGDVVLPGITPNISFFPGHGDDHDPLGDYSKTLKNIREKIPDEVLVLPSHGEPFVGLHQRIDEIRAHHERRLKQVDEICKAAPKTALQVMEEMFSYRKLDGTMDMFFALGEVLAHLVYLEKRGHIRKTVENGVARFIQRLPDKKIIDRGDQTHTLERR